MILEKLRHMSIEAREVCLGYKIDRLHVSGLDTLRFVADYVARNKPCIISGAMDSWPALELWDEPYLTAAGGGSLVTVDRTPDGRADAIAQLAVREGEGFLTSEEVYGTREEWFCGGMEEQMTMGEFFAELKESRKCDPQQNVLYLQHQNDSLNTEAPWLLDDTRAFPFSRAFCQEPEATNLWIGDERSKTSFHKDHYENIYSVVQGEKVFKLLPPLEVWRMYMKEYPSARWTRDRQGWRAVRDGGVVPWCPIPFGSNPTSEAAMKYPHFYDRDLPPPLIAEVGKAETLYLPSCWYHSVEQVPFEKGGIVIAVNSWFDMKFDTRWPYFQFVESTSKDLDLAAKASVQET